MPSGPAAGRPLAAAATGSMTHADPVPRALSDLLIITPQFVACLCVAGLTTFLAACYFARQHRRVAAVVAGLLAFLLLPATAADAFNAHYQYLPRVADVVNTPTWPTARAAVVLNTAKPAPPEPTGAVVQLSLPGRVSGFGSHAAYIYLPPQYFLEPTRRFPVVYLIHGSPGGPIDWFRSARAAQAGALAAKAGTPTIIVAPRASRSWTDDSECVNRPQEHVETYLAVDVPAGVDRLLRTVATRTGRVIAGNSAGGYCALNVGLRHRDVFSGIIDLSGYDHPTYDGGMAALFGPRPSLGATVTANDPSQYVKTLPAGPSMAIWIDTGRSDDVPRRNAHRMLGLLRSAGQQVTLHERAGGHDYGVWRPALQESLLAMARKMTNATL